MKKTTKKPRRRGRPPKGEFHNKNAKLSTRITEEVHKGLKREAKRNGRSLSQEVEFRLRQSLEAPKKSELAYGNKRNRSLALLVDKLAAHLESSTRKSWREDRYTHDALRSGIDIVMAYLAPEGEVAVPEWITEEIARISNIAKAEKDKEKRVWLLELLELKKRWELPKELGTSCALGMIDQIRWTEAPPIDHPRNVHYADGFFQFPAVREALGLNGDEK